VSDYRRKATKWTSDVYVNAGRQAQYELMREMNCYWGAYYPRDERDCSHENTPGACPTDYRECALYIAQSSEAASPATKQSKDCATSETSTKDGE
jgi:hypothetical protein